MTGRNNWTHDELKAAAAGDFSKFKGVNRRDVLKGGLAAAAGAMMVPFMPGLAQAAVGGDINTLTWEGYDGIEPTKAWAAKNGVAITNGSMATQDDVQTKLVGGSPVRLDVTSYNQAYNRFYGDELKIINPLDMSKIPNYNKDDIFDAFYQKERWYWDAKQFGIPFCWGLVAPIFNTDKVQGINSYTDFLKPGMKGKFVISDDNTGTWPVFAALAGVTTYPNVTKDELGKIFENAKLYRDNAKSFAASNGDIVSLMMSGEIWGCLTCGTDSVASVKRQGGKASYSIPSEGAFLWCDALCVPHTTGNSETAHAFINEFMSAPAQAWLAQHTVCGSANNKSVALMDADTKALFDYANLDEVMKKNSLKGIPPRESKEYAAYDEWVQAYEGLKSGI